MIATTRLDALRCRLAADGAGAVLITLPSSLRYVTGFEGVIDDGINAAALVTADGARFFTDGRYIEAARAAAIGGEWEIVPQRENLYADVSERMNALVLDTVLMESAAPHQRFLKVGESFSGTVRPVDDYVEEIRIVKEPAEIEHIAEAASIADAGFQHLLEYITVGATERQIAIELEFFMRTHGSEEMPFAPIVASGPQGARPHAIPGERRVKRGDLIVLDFGARVGGYCSDMTRTVAVGQAGDRDRELYEAVLAANEAGLAAVRAGVAAFDVDKAARDVLVERGLGDLFTHGLGHGVGLDIHELPTVGPRSKAVLDVGNVITIEPGVYMEGLAGVRIEDLVVVEELGRRRLTNAPKELIEL